MLQLQWKLSHSGLGGCGLRLNICSLSYHCREVVLLGRQGCVQLVLGGVLEIRSS